MCFSTFDIVKSSEQLNETKCKVCVFLEIMLPVTSEISVAWPKRLAR